jgi:hypothetical protein
MTDEQKQPLSDEIIQDAYNDAVADMHNWTDAGIVGRLYALYDEMIERGLVEADDAPDSWPGTRPGKGRGGKTEEGD